MDIYMKFKKDTKNKHVFEECDEMGKTIPADNATIAGLYIAKTALNGPAKFLTIKLETGLTVNTDV